MQYFEVKSNLIRKPSVVYRSVPGHVYVDPAQVGYLKVNVSYIGSDIHIARDEYQWLCDRKPHLKTIVDDCSIVTYFLFKLLVSALGIGISETDAFLV